LWDGSRPNRKRRAGEADDRGDLIRVRRQAVLMKLPLEWLNVDAVWIDVTTPSIAVIRSSR
jgi:hypothetical protein